MACLTQLWVIQIHPAKALMICGRCRTAERQHMSSKLIPLSLFHASRGFIERSAGQKKAGGSHPAHAQMTLFIGYRSKRKGLFQHSPSDDAGSAVRRCQLNRRKEPTIESIEGSLNLMEITLRDNAPASLVCLDFCFLR